MFTGIIEAKGHIEAIVPSGNDMRVRIATGKLDLSDVKLGDSIAVNGVCLTAVELPGDGFWADVSAETLAHTTFKTLAVATVVNLEKALTPTTRLGKEYKPSMRTLSLHTVVGLLSFCLSLHRI